MNRVSNFGDRLKEYRDMYGYTLEYLSERTGVPAQTLNRYELTQRVPKIDAAVMISESLGVNPLWMQGYDAPMKKEETPGQLQLTEGEKAILALFRQVPDENKGAAAKTLHLLSEVPAEHLDMVVDMILVAVSKKQ